MRPLLLCLSLLLLACATLSTQDQVRQLIQSPLPAGTAERASACASVHALQARLTDILADRVNLAESPFVAASDHQAAQHDLPLLDARERALQCATLPPAAVAAAAAPAASALPAVGAATTSGTATPAAAGAASPLSRAAAPGEDFDRCFQRCRSYTDRSKEQCFDVCNR